MSIAPFFSIVIPTLNSGPKLERTLRSVLDQPEDLRELIVMDGASTDGTLALLAALQHEYRGLSWRSDPDSGVYDAMNKGIKLAAGAYAHFLGAGDALRPDALKNIRQVAPEGRLALVYGDVRIVSSDRLHGGGGPYAAERLAYDAPCHQAIFYARPVFDLVGDYDTKYVVSADWALNMRCFGDSRIQKIYHSAVVADFEGGGLSANGPDKQFVSDRPRLVGECLGMIVSGDRFFAADQFALLRIAEARNIITRKLWRGARLGLRHLPPKWKCGKRV